jgi:hypothetical protein
VYTDRTCHFRTHLDPPLVLRCLLQRSSSPLTQSCLFSWLTKNSNHIKSNASFLYGGLNYPSFSNLDASNLFLICAPDFFYNNFSLVCFKKTFLWLFDSKCDYFYKNLELIQQYTTLVKNYKFQIWSKE